MPYPWSCNRDLDFHTPAGFLSIIRILIVISSGNNKIILAMIARTAIVILAVITRTAFIVRIIIITTKIIVHSNPFNIQVRGLTSSLPFCNSESSVAGRAPHKHFVQVSFQG